MSILAGIDEAGYGPILGPLVVSVVAFRLEEAQADADLWEVLSEGVSRTRRRGDSRVAVGDSKALLRSGSSLAALEEGVLAFLNLAGLDCASLRVMMASLGADRNDEWDTYPWYRDRDVPLPQDADPDRVGRLADRLSQTLDSEKVSLVRAVCDPMHVEEYNALVTQWNNKAMSTATRALGLLEQLWRGFADEGLSVVIDKLGGRNSYRTWLMATFEGARVLSFAEGARASLYQVEHDDRRMAVAFEAKADANHLAVSLASMMSKYVRELFMKMFNAYWRERAPDVKPTAGYVQDGRRFLGEIAPYLDAYPALTRMLVRVR